MLAFFLSQDKTQSYHPAWLARILTTTDFIDFSFHLLLCYTFSVSIPDPFCSCSEPWEADAIDCCGFQLDLANGGAVS